MIVIDDFEELKRKHARDQKELDRIDGALDQVLGEIKERFGCQTIEEARRKLSKLRKKREEMTDEYMKARTAYDSASKRRKKKPGR